MLVFKSKRMRTGLSSKKETDGSRPFVDIVDFKYFVTSQKVTIYMVFPGVVKKSPKRLIYISVK